MYPVSVWRLMLRAMMDIRALPVSLADRPLGPFGSPDYGCAGETVSPSPVPLADLGGTLLRAVRCICSNATPSVKSCSTPAIESVRVTPSLRSAAISEL
jgi:hypothetical protein